MRMRYIELAVGVFMVMGMVALIAMALRVSGLSADSYGPTYTLKARFENLGGLTDRAKVSLGGVTVGRVTKIYLDKERYAAVVEMAISKNLDNLPKDSSASILTAGLLGEKYIALSIGAEDDFLKTGDWIEETQSAFILEDMIGRFLFSQDKK